MISNFDGLEAYPAITVEAGDVLIEEGGQSDRIYVLVEGMVEVYRGEISIALISERGALFGEMSVLLDTAHTASVRAATDCTLHVVDGARDYVRQHPAFVLPIAKLLAERLQHVTSYLVDIKRQFSDRSDHFQMMDEMLEALVNAQPQRFSPPDGARRDRLGQEDREDQ